MTLSMNETVVLQNEYESLSVQDFDVLYIQNSDESE